VADRQCSAPCRLPRKTEPSLVLPRRFQASRSPLITTTARKGAAPASRSGVSSSWATGTRGGPELSRRRRRSGSPRNRSPGASSATPSAPRRSPPSRRRAERRSFACKSAIREILLLGGEAVHAQGALKQRHGEEDDAERQAEQADGNA